MQIPGGLRGKLELMEMSKYHTWQTGTCPQGNFLANLVHR